MEYRYRLFLNRVVNFMRPRPSRIPLTVSEILDSKDGLSVVERFNDLYYTSGASGRPTWRGIEMPKTPCDLWMVLELLQRIKPSVIIETGTLYGGSATFYAEMAAAIGFPCKVVTIDCNPHWNYDPTTKGIVSLVGYSTSPKIIAQVEQIVQGNPGPVMAMLDADHREENVLQELHFYAPFITKDSFLIVEDTNVNGHPSYPDFGPGPYEAVEKFLATNRDFVIDRNCERFLLTYYPKGWLRRVT